MQRHVDRHLERVIRRTILDAKLSGKDYPTQNQVAAHTVRRIRPDMTAKVIFFRALSGSGGVGCPLPGGGLVSAPAK